MTRKRTIRNLLLLFLAVMAMAVLGGCGKETIINLNDYVTISAEGYDSMGTAVGKFDIDKFLEDYNGKIDVNLKNNSTYAMEQALGSSPEQILFASCVNYTFKADNNLSNGDVVNFVWDCDAETAKKDFGVTLKYEDIEYKVEGLKEVGKINPFDYVDVTFSGISPAGAINISPDYEKTEMQYISFSADKTYNLKNGDEVTVTAAITGSVDTFVENYGVVLEKTEQVYTVENLSAYISDITQLSDDVYNKIDAQLRDNLTSDFASWDGENLLDMELLGTYVLNRKEGSGSDYFNYVYFVYKVTAENPASDGPFNYYWYGYYTNVVADTDGSSDLDVMDFNVPYDDWYSSEYFQFENQGSYGYYGFKDLESLYNAHVVTKLSGYEFTSTVNE